MALTAHPTLGKQKAIDICNAFVAGAPQNAVGHVFYGVNATNVEEWRRVVRSGEEFFFVDNAYTDATRQTHFRVTRNMLQHTGEGASDGKRFTALGIDIKPWRTAGDHIVVCPQSELFMSMVVGHRGDWARHIAGTLANLSRRPQLIRMWSRDKGHAAATLAKDLTGAHALVTWSSAAAVTAVLAGVPVVTLGQCAAGRMSGSLANLEQLPTPDRKNWISVLADNQFTLLEISSGYAWKALNQ